LFFGIAWIGGFTAWLPSTISFLLVLITGSGLNEFYYFLIGNISIPLFLVIWLLAFTELKYVQYRKYIVGFYIIIGVIYEIFFIYYLLNDLSAIGEMTGYMDVTYRGVVRYYLIFTVLTMLTTGILFCLESFKSENPEIRLKGKFLLVSFITWSIGAIMDAALPLNAVTLLIARSILILSTFSFYLGFNLPKFVKNLFLSEK